MLQARRLLDRESFSVITKRTVSGRSRPRQPRSSKAPEAYPSNPDKAESLGETLAHTEAVMSSKMSRKGQFVKGSRLPVTYATNLSILTDSSLRLPKLPKLTAKWLKVSQIWLEVKETSLKCNTEPSNYQTILGASLPNTPCGVYVEVQNLELGRRNAGTPKLFFWPNT